ncbi:hypothetical protein [Cysteiniphilum sp. JM-1]|uniref:hypothetical protein n=1 Tax=Cysteiniphilum sp. JM-1 TaxID=2610891 RepID=UPI001244D606|nr:hypothetical protein [Cysteiniphilum sp. JM-1]
MESQSKSKNMTSMAGKENILIPKITHKELGEGGEIYRDITVINGYPFYCSSGQSSYMANTWFPFCGINPDGTFIKPCGLYTQGLSQMIKFLGAEFIGGKKYMNNIKDTKLPRFGNIETAYISYALGGGFWSDSESFSADLCKKFTEYFKDKFPFLIDTQISVSPFSQFTTEDSKKVNDWLKEQGANLNGQFTIFDPAFAKLDNLNKELGKPAAYIKTVSEGNTLVNKKSLSELQVMFGKDALVNTGAGITHGRGDNEVHIPVLNIVTNNTENNTKDELKDKPKVSLVTMFRGNKPDDGNSTPSNQF